MLFIIMALISHDTKEHFHFRRKTGLRTLEDSTLSTHNLYPSIDNFHSIRIFEKDDCPMDYGLGFSPKSELGTREIPLSERSIRFIKTQLEKHKKDKIYGVIGKRNEDFELVEYPFLFPYYDGILKKWLRRKTFIRAFHTLIKTAVNETDIKLDGRVIPHDLRRNVNLWLREKGFTGDEAAFWLGHTLETNERNYLAISKKQELLRSKTLEKARKLLNFGKPQLEVVRVDFQNKKAISWHKS
ncbi:MAG: hypothetical protein ABIA04_14125 [Pseudomonadota bacterium]